MDKNPSHGEGRITMSRNDRVVEDRKVRNFDRVVLSVHNMMNRMEITQGEHESLTIEARAEILPKIRATVRGGELAIQLDGSLLDKLQFALATSFTRPVVRYHLTVKDLASLELAGFVHADVPALQAGNLSLRLTGAGVITIASLTAQQVTAELQGAGQIKLGGQVKRQDVAIQGPGLYEAVDLKSVTTRVSLKGPGRARIWATDELEVKVRGLGRVEVRGTPKIYEDVSPRVPLPRFGHP
jgi:hypothetical protein